MKFQCLIEVSNQHPCLLSVDFLMYIASGNFFFFLKNKYGYSTTIFKDRLPPLQQVC